MVWAIGSCSTNPQGHACWYWLFLLFSFSLSLSFQHSISLHLFKTHPETWIIWWISSFFRLFFDTLLLLHLPRPSTHTHTRVQKRKHTQKFNQLEWKSYDPLYWALFDLFKMLSWMIYGSPVTLSFQFGFLTFSSSVHIRCSTNICSIFCYIVLPTFIGKIENSLFV